MLMIDPTGLAVTVKEFPLPPIIEIVTVVLTSVTGVLALSAALEGYFKSDMSPMIRAILAVGALLLIYPGLITGLAGAAIVITIAVLNTRNSDGPTPTVTI